MKTVMAVVCALSASLASAHNLWIEPTSSDMQAVYGEPEIRFDIVPTSEPYTFAVHFNGAPLKRGTLKVIAPSLWLQVHDIDEQGLVRIHAPWRGQYVLDVDTREQRSGEVAGQRYDSMVHRATLSFSTPEGAVFENPRPAQYRTNYQ